MASNFEAIPIVVLSVDGDFVERYKSIMQAEAKLDVSRRCISNCLLNRRVSAGGYIFIKEENYNPAVKVTKASLLRKRKFLRGSK